MKAKVLEDFNNRPWLIDRRILFSCRTPAMTLDSNRVLSMNQGKGYCNSYPVYTLCSSSEQKSESGSLAQKTRLKDFPFSFRVRVGQEERPNRVTHRKRDPALERPDSLGHRILNGCCLATHLIDSTCDPRPRKAPEIPRKVHEVDGGS